MNASTNRAAVEPLTVRAEEGAKLIGCGKTLFLEMDKDGRLGPQSIRYGRVKVWDRDELVDWFKAGRPRREAWAEIRKKPVAKSA